MIIRNRMIMTMSNKKIQLSVRIYLSWTSNQIVFIILLLLSYQQRVKLSPIVKNWVSIKSSMKIEWEEQPDHT
jgi:hypothetical protein